MLLHGDELGRSQNGNNNAYAQDGPLSWIDWGKADAGLVGFVSKVARLREAHPVFRRRRFFDGRPVERGDDSALPDIVWLRPDAAAMAPADWDSGFGRSIGMFLNGGGLPDCDDRGRPVVDDCFLLLFNGGGETVHFTLPGDEYATRWVVEIHTDGIAADGFAAGGSVPVTARSVLVLRAPDRN